MYPIGYKHRVVELPFSARKETGRIHWLLAVLLLVSTGIAYRVVRYRLNRILGDFSLPVSLDVYPRRIGRWVGEDVPIPVNIQEVAGNDAFINRLYKNKSTKEWVNVYISYTSQPQTMLGHRPRVCYVAGGWIHDGTELSQMTTRSDRELLFLIHRFHKSAPKHEETVVLNFYIVNGRLTCDHKVFAGLGWRTPNIDGDPARYVAQVQISSAFENSVRMAAKDMAELILEFLPDENGEVTAVRYVKSSGDVQK
jgi:hypothetical protein